MKNFLIKIASIATELDNNGLEKEAKQMHRIFLKIAEDITNFTILEAAKQAKKEAQREYDIAVKKYQELLEKMKDSDFRKKFNTYDQYKVGAWHLTQEVKNTKKRLDEAVEVFEREKAKERPKSTFHVQSENVHPDLAAMVEQAAKEYERKRNALEDQKSKESMEYAQQLGEKDLAERKKWEEKAKLDERERQFYRGLEEKYGPDWYNIYNRIMGVEPVVGFSEEEEFARKEKESKARAEEDARLQKQRQEREELLNSPPEPVE